LATEQDLVLIQALLLTDAGREADLLRTAGFSSPADLLYMVSLADDFPGSPLQSNLVFSSVAETGPARLANVIHRTYQATLDCPSLNSVRSIDDVLAGYRAVGRYRPALWLVVQDGKRDVGCVLLADHSPQRIWEIVYLGVVPEARGKGLGLEITRYAQWLAGRESAQRMVLAVDAGNEPAIAVYATAGFVSWDRRSVFVRLIGNTLSS
jgi:ribosomal protein S18 acetylase RimI-like enzyme